MNTKGIKFLAVLAVMVMAFAAIVALAPADNDIVAENVYAYKDAQKDPTVITAELTDTANGGYDKFYISEDAVVKVTGLTKDITIYVQNGKELELNIKPVTTSGAPAEKLDHKIAVKTVTADQKRIANTSTIDGKDTDPKSTTGKIVLEQTIFEFTGIKSQSVTYQAMMPYFVDTHTTSADGKKVITNVYTKDSSVSPSKQLYAVISSDSELLTPKIGSQVTIATGQSIETYATMNTDFTAYGVKIVDKPAPTTNDDTKTTFYAVKADAGSFDATDGDEVYVYDGTVTVNNDNTYVKATAAKGVQINYGGTDKLTVKTIGGTDKDSMTAGALTVSGTVEFDAIKIGSSATVSVSNNTTVTGSAYLEGKLNLRNTAEGIAQFEVTGTGVISALNEKLWFYPDDTPTKPLLKFLNTVQDDQTGEWSMTGFTGQFDVYSITKIAYVDHGFSTAKIEKNQTFIVVADTVVTTELNVEGVLIVNEGITLTITKINSVGAAVTTSGQYAQIINNGEILIKTTKGSGTSTTTDSGLHVHAGMFENNGKIIASSDADTLKGSQPTICVDYDDTPLGFGFVNNGTITASQNDFVSFDNKFTNSASGSVSINGKFTAPVNAFVNKGAFTLTNAKISEDVKVKMNKGSVFNVVAAELKSGKSIAIEHDSTSASSAITVAAVGGDVTVRGICVVDTGDKYNGYLDLSGTMGITKVGTTPGYATLTMSQGITVKSGATIGEGYLLDLKSATLAVFADLTVNKKGSAIPTPVDGVPDDSIAGLKLNVTGKVTDIENRLGACTAYLAAKYSLANGTTIYTTLENAVPAAAEADVSLITVGEYPAIPNVDPKKAIPATYPKVTADLVIPEGVFVSGTGLVVGDSESAPTILIEESAGFSFTTVKLVDGMIVAESANDVNAEAIAADVKVIDTETYSATFMSLGVAILLADEGDTIVLSQDFEGISSDLVIPAGITVDATAAEDSDKYFTLIDSNLVVNGILIVNDFWFIATTDDTKSITVNGMIMDYHTDGKCLTDWWYTPIGVSYKLTIPDETGDEHTWYVITSLDNLQESIYLADDAKVNVEGDVVLDDLTIHGTEEGAEVTFKGDVTAGTITIDNVELKFLDGNEVTATVADALGSITIIGAYVDKALSIYSLDDQGVYMAGAVIDDTIGTYLIRFDGITGIDGTSKSTIGWGKYVKEDELAGTPTILFNGTTTVTGKRAVISNTVDDTDTTGMATITGTVYVDNGTKFVVNCSTEILGALVAAERTEANPGSIEINGNIFVGMLESDIYDYDAEFNVNAGAVLSGKVSLANGKWIYVAPSATVDPAITEDLDTMNIYIDNEVWFTLFGYSGIEFNLDYLAVPMFNAKVAGIYDADLNLLKYRMVGNVINQDDASAESLAEYGAIYIGLNYDIFEVKIKTDGSVKAVYIDGILMETGFTQNIFVMQNVAAGTHKVTVEAATGYDADKCVLYTEMGTILPGMAFTFTEYDVTEYDVDPLDDDVLIPVVVYNINGTEIQPEPVPPTPEEESQWTITTILLVILVVLIAIMAVIVALRLNRS